MLKRFLGIICGVFLASSSFGATITSDVFKGNTADIGTVNSTNINVTNLDADNITGNALNQLIASGNWVNANGYATLALADAAAVSATKLLIIAEQWNTVPDTLNANIVFVPGGKLNNSNDVTFTGEVVGFKGCFIGSGKILGLKTAEPTWFGAIPDDGLDDVAAFRKAEIASRNIHVPKGTYNFNGTWNIKHTLYIYGDAGTQAGLYPSMISVADGVTGIFIHNIDTTADDATGLVYGIETPSTTGAGGTIIERLMILRGATGADPETYGESHGIHAKARFLLRNAVVGGFQGDAIHVVASASTSGTSRGNANNFAIEYVRIINSFNGLFVDGSDVNAGTIIGLDSSSNKNWGIWDSSFLGNTYIGCHVSSNGIGGYMAEGANNRSTFVGSYTEGGQITKIDKPSIHMGGISSVGEGDGVNLDSPIGTSGIVSSLPSMVSRIDITDAGSGLVAAPTVSIAPPSGYSTATATANIVNGKVKTITVANAGAGYSTTPTVTISGNGTGATAIAHVSDTGAITEITVTNSSVDNAGGSGYTSATVSIDPPTVTTATAVGVINTAGQLIGVTITNPGAGYTNIPNVSIGSGCAGTAVLTNGESAKLYANTGAELFSFWRDDVSTATAWRLKMMKNTGDLQLDWGNSSNNLGFFITGPKAGAYFGRPSSTPYALWTKKLFVGDSSTNARQINVSNTYPTSGDYVRGDIVLNRSALDGLPMGWVCTETGSPGTWVALPTIGGLELTQMSAQAASTATDVAGLKTDFNSLLTKLRASGLLAQ